ncbi:DUF6302 family protein [Streptomyces sp. NPDC088400]|uniref:DUF6302 family protein n=1 Tax=Streptomyces sp. NPDC088400 TaxID=3365861 RepID=UPI00380733DA
MHVAVAVHVDGFASLAVPTGGRRLGGFMPFGRITSALAVRRALTSRPGFSNVRVRWAQDIDVCHAVEWGARVPCTEDDVIRGRFYGYRTEAIDRFRAELSAAPDVLVLSALISAHNRRGAVSA